ncbi:MAG: histone H1 [Planctomycetota bacterium]
MRAFPQIIIKEIDMLETYESLKALIVSIEDDIKKAAGGNRAAGTRVRKEMQEVKNIAQDLRKKILEAREGESS